MPMKLKIVKHLSSLAFFIGVVVSLTDDIKGSPRNFRGMPKFDENIPFQIYGPFPVDNNFPHPKASQTTHPRSIDTLVSVSTSSDAKIVNDTECAQNVLFFEEIIHASSCQSRARGDSNDRDENNFMLNLDIPVCEGKSLLIQTCASTEMNVRIESPVADGYTAAGNITLSIDRLESSCAGTWNSLKDQNNIIISKTFSFQSTGSESTAIIHRNLSHSDSSCLTYVFQVDGPTTEDHCTFQWYFSAVCNAEASDPEKWAEPNPLVEVFLNQMNIIATVSG